MCLTLAWGPQRPAPSSSNVSNIIATATLPERCGEIKDLPRPHNCYVAKTEFVALEASYSSKVSKFS